LSTDPLFRIIISTHHVQIIDAAASIICTVAYGGNLRKTEILLAISAISHKSIFMRTTLDLPDPIFRRLKAESALRGQKLKELVAELIETGLQGPPSESSARVRSPLPRIRKATGQVNEALSNHELDSILTTGEIHGRP
jgi:hypothetical protein